MWFHKPFLPHDVTPPLQGKWQQGIIFTGKKETFSMAIYSISDLEKLSGIKSHTIRMWEQRYGILRPQRTPTNIRFYQDNDLQLLLNVALLNRHGYKISKIAAMSKEDLVRNVNDVSEVNIGLDAELDVLTLAVIEMDEYKFLSYF